MAHLLIVDADPLGQLNANRILVEGGHTCETVSTSAAAFAAIDTGRFDGVVTDWHLERKGAGEDVLRHARSRGVRAILCYGHPEGVEFAQQRGFRAVDKASEVTDLLPVVNQTIPF